MSFIDELQNDRNLIKNNLIEIRDYIVDICMKNIKNVNTSGGTSFNYSVPEFIIGYPVYNHEKMAKLVNKKLKQLKLTTIISNQNTIFISWIKNVK